MTDLPPQGDPQTQFPKVFGRYLLVTLLNRGGMGEVYLAKAGQISGFEKIVVIKKILPSLSSNPDFSRKFISEAQIAIKLNHVNIVPVLEVGRLDGEFFIAMDYVEGMDLRRIMSKQYKQERPLRKDLALLVARDLLTGLSYAHRRVDEEGRPLQIVHCDISPPNVLVSYEGEVKIIDFGVAKSVLAAEEESSHLGFGKFGYMAPEQILKGKEVDARTDIYSAGVVLWELLTGQRMLTFSQSTPFKEVAKKVVLEPPVPPSDVNPDLDERFDSLVLKAISKHPEDRYQTAAEFRNEVQKLLAELNPTLTNDDLGEYIRELFREEIEKERTLIRQAKAIDIHEFEDELTQAMEHTVSFAVGEDLPGGAVGDVVMLPAPPVSRGGTGGLTQKISLLDPRKRRALTYVTAGLVLLAMVIWMVLLARHSSDDEIIEIAGIQMPELPYVTPVKAPPSLRPQPVPKVDVVSKVTGSPDSPPPVPKSISSAGKRPSRRRTTRRHVYRRPKPKKKYTKTSVMAASKSSAASNNSQSAQLKATLNSLYHSVKREYSKFKNSHGEMLSTRWVPLSTKVERMLRTPPDNVSPAKYQRLIDRLNRFRNKMRQF